MQIISFTFKKNIYLLALIAISFASSAQRTGIPGSANRASFGQDLLDHADKVIDGPIDPDRNPIKYYKRVPFVPLVDSIAKTFKYTVVWEFVPMQFITIDLYTIASLQEYMQRLALTDLFSYTIKRKTKTLIITAKKTL